MVEIVVGVRAGRGELADLGEELEAGSLEIEPVLRGRKLPLQGRLSLGLVAKARPQALDVPLVLANGRLDLLLLLGPTAAGGGRGGVVAAGQTGTGGAHVRGPT